MKVQFNSFRTFLFLSLMAAVSSCNSPLKIEESKFKEKSLVAASVSVANSIEDQELILNLHYSGGILANSCDILNLSHLTVTTPCSCDDAGVCTVGITGVADYFGSAGLDYVVSSNEIISNTATQEILIAGVDDAPVALTFSPDDEINNKESFITLSYSDKESDPGESCSVSDLSNLTVSTPCACDGDGVCIVGVSGGENYSGSVSFNYTVTANGLTSNSANVSFNLYPQPFVSVWRVGDPAYGNGNLSITLPLRSGYNYNMTVDWGDGSTSEITSYNVGNTHLYTEAGDYTVTIRGTAETWYFNFSGDRSKLISVINLGNLGWTNLEKAFQGCDKLESFAGGETSKVTDMSYMFSGNHSLVDLDLSSLNTSSVTNMRWMFYGASKLASLDLSNFNTSSVEYMDSMFSNINLTTLDLSSFDTTSLKNMSYMFNESRKLTNINLSSFDTRTVTNMSGVFFNNSSLTSLDVSHFDTSNVTNMGGMFQNVSGIKSLDVSRFNTSKVENMSDMFARTSFESIDVSSFDTSSVVYMGNMFYGTNFKSLDLSNFKTDKVIYMQEMFRLSSKLKSLNTTGWDVSQVTSSSGIWDSTDPALVVSCNQGGSPGTGTFFGKNCQ